MIRTKNVLKFATAIALILVLINSEEIATSDLVTDAAITSASSSSTVPCYSSDPSYDNSLKIAEDVRFFWKVDGSSLEGSLLYNGIGWIGFGISDTSGSMIGADAIIGNPDLAFEHKMAVLKYNIDSNSLDGIVPMEESLQSLKDASVTQDSDTTVLTFTKLLKEDGEKEILSSGTNTFIWTVGNSNTLNQEPWRSFDLDLSNCEDKTDLEVETQAAAKMIMAADTPTYNKKAFIIHSVLAVFAWGLCAPFAVSTALFRRLAPTWWIYLHVLANVACFFFTLIAFIVAVVAVGHHPNTTHFSHSHHYVGLIIMLFVTIQVMNGFMRPPVEKVTVYQGEEDGMYRSPREVWHAVHKYSGTTLLFLSVYQVSTGLTLFSELFGTKSILPLYWTTVFLFLISVLVVKLSMICDLRSQDSNNDKNSFNTMDEIQFSSPHGDMSSLEGSNRNPGLT